MNLGFPHKETMIKKDELIKMIIAKEQEVVKEGVLVNGNII